MTSIQRGAFAFCVSLRCIQIPDSITNIGRDAFWTCTSLASVTLPNSDCSFGTGLFDSCRALTNATIPDRITYIPDSAFSRCQNLKRVEIGSGTTFIASGAFMGCSSLTDVIMGNGVTNLAGFFACTSLVSITLPASVTVIQPYAFTSCDRLSSVFFQGDAPADVPNMFPYSTYVIVYYLPGTRNWNTTLSGRPAVLWNPRIERPHFEFSGSDRVIFEVTGTPNIPIVVEASPELGSASWTPLQVCTLTNGTLFITDSYAQNGQVRLYRIRSP